MEKAEYRSYIKGRTLLGVKPIDIHRELNYIMEEEVPHYSTVTRLSKSFNEGRIEVEDLKRTSRPKSAINDESIKQIKDLIEEDPHITYDEMEEQTTLSRGTIFNIIKDSLGLKKITKRFVPYILTVQNKQKNKNIASKIQIIFVMELVDFVISQQKMKYLSIRSRLEENEATNNGLVRDRNHSLLKNPIIMIRNTYLEYSLEAQDGFIFIQQAIGNNQQITNITLIISQYQLYELLGIKDQNLEQKEQVYNMIMPERTLMRMFQPSQSKTRSLQQSTHHTLLISLLATIGFLTLLSNALAIIQTKKAYLKK
ncbi:hypothetical protein ABPG72_012130 [Tetrahymena utriculariae]